VVLLCCLKELPYLAIEIANNDCPFDGGKQMNCLI
jgi:hypothetical protein